ncbi:MAG: cupin domain-containing protein [Anaerostipes sp.]|jgi:quercetin dioxygenase-like cupin family protein
MELKPVIMDSGRIPWFYRPNSATGKIFGKKALHLDEDTQMVIDYMDYPAGFTTIAHKHLSSHGLFVLEGQLKVDEEYYGPGTFVWFPEGVIATHGAAENEGVKCLLISNKAFSIEYVGDEKNNTGLEKVVVDIHRMPWFYRPTSTTGKIFGKKQLLLDSETGMEINYMDYPAGFTTIKHRHSAGHGLFVLEGQLLTGGDLYGPGTLVWYPEGIEIDHGATKEHGVKCLLISNKTFSIEYVS